MIERIDPPAPGGPPYSGLVVAGHLVFVAGQVGSDSRTGAVPAGIKAQTQVVLSNIEAKLKKAGCGLKDVVKSTVFLADIRGFEEMNEVYRAAFAPHFPARSTIEARLARPEFLVEIEVIVYRPEGPRTSVASIGRLVLGRPLPSRKLRGGQTIAVLRLPSVVGLRLSSFDRGAP